METTKPQRLEPLSARYLMIVPIPFYVDEDGQVWLEEGWHRDFVEHLEYLPKLTLAAPRLPKGDRSDLCRLDCPAGTDVRFVPLPPMRSTLAATLSVPQIAARFWKAIGDADVVQSGVAGWPFPLGWVANPIVRFRKRKLLLIVESAPWRLTGAGDDGLKGRIRAAVTEHLARYFVDRAQMILVTQPGYRDSLRSRPEVSCLVQPATWINDEDLISSADAERCWAAKDPVRTERVRLLFAGRLVQQKGLLVLIEAARLAAERGTAVDIDIVGEGPELPLCQAAVAASTNLRLRDAVPYHEFFALLREYHAIVVPSLSDEQPRVIFDAYSQAMPVIAADTDGLRPYVRDGESGWIVPPGDAEALARVFAELADGRAEIVRRGYAALDASRRMTHRAMHRERRAAFASFMNL